MQDANTDKRAYGEYHFGTGRRKNGSVFYWTRGPRAGGGTNKKQHADESVVREQMEEWAKEYEEHEADTKKLNELEKKYSVKERLAIYQSYEASGSKHGPASCIAAGAAALKEKNRTVEVAVKAFYERINARTVKMKKNSLGRLKLGLERFRERFSSLHVNAVDCEMVEKFLEESKMKKTGKPLSDSEHDKTVEAISTFYNSLLARGEAKFNPARGIQRKNPKAKNKNAAEIVMPSVVECLLRDLETYTGCAPNAPKTAGFLIPMVIIECAGGVRPGIEDGEISKLRVSDIVLERRYIRIKASIAKNREERIIHIRDNMYEWLVRYLPKDPNAFIIPPNAKREMDQLRKKYDIPHDGLRHTFVTGLFGLLGDLELVAKEAGTCAKTLEEHYLNRKHAEECKKIFEIYPSDYIRSETIYFDLSPETKCLLPGLKQHSFEHSSDSSNLKSYTTIGGLKKYGKRKRVQAAPS